MFITGLLGKITSFSANARNLGRGAPKVTAPEQWKLKKTVVLVGMMGAGKTAVGKALAVALHVPFLDSDAEIERAANMSIAEIFERDGEAFFRDRETQVIDRLLADECGVLSTGGGAFLAQRNRELISRKGVSVWLKVDLPILWSPQQFEIQSPYYARLVVRDRAMEASFHNAEPRCAPDLQ